MTLHTDPTYLRTIHDGLLSGAVHKDNASALPQGLVGMYEEALPPAINVNERKKFLVFFAVWALLKKEVSAGFVVPLLEGWSEEEVLEYIAQYSKWFNSPTGGTYVLYHERLRAFVLQKISDAQLKACNEAIIHQCRVALQVKAGDEWERYALEHLGSHLLIQAMASKDATELKALVYDTAHWNRQVEISKGFEWSKRMLNDMMLWASKYDDDEVIECALNKVDLHHQEQNDAPRIVELVAQNDMDTALQRIESFGSKDQEGLQRKFILYMLCLMELTLLDSKDKPFRKEAIEKLLKHLDDNLPVDHSILNWNDFFPSSLMFKLMCEFENLKISSTSILRFFNTWSDDEWPIEKYELKTIVKIFKRLLVHDWRRSIDVNAKLSSFLAKVFSLDDAQTSLVVLLKELEEYSDLIYARYCLALIEKGQIDSLENFLSEVSDLGRKLIILKRTIEWATRNGEITVKDLVRNQLDVIQINSSTKLEIKIHYYHVLALLYKCESNLNLTRHCFILAINDITREGKSSSDRLLRMLLKDAYSVFECEYINSILDKISRHTLRNEAAKEYINYLCLVNKIDQAYDLASQFENPIESGLLIGNIASYQILEHGVDRYELLLNQIPFEVLSQVILTTIKELLLRNRVSESIKLTNRLFAKRDIDQANYLVAIFYHETSNILKYDEYKVKIETPYFKLKLLSYVFEYNSKKTIENSSIFNELSLLLDDLIQDNQKHKYQIIDSLRILFAIDNGDLIKSFVISFVNRKYIDRRREIDGLIIQGITELDHVLILLEHANINGPSRDLKLIELFRSAFKQGPISNAEAWREAIKYPLYRLDFDCYLAEIMLQSSDPLDELEGFLIAQDLLAEYYRIMADGDSRWVLLERYNKNKLKEVRINLVSILVLAKMEIELMQLIEEVDDLEEKSRMIILYFQTLRKVNRPVTSLFYTDLLLMLGSTLERAISEANFLVISNVALEYGAQRNKDKVCFIFDAAMEIVCHNYDRKHEVIFTSICESMLLYFDVSHILKRLLVISDFYVLVNNLILLSRLLVKKGLFKESMEVLNFTLKEHCALLIEAKYFGLIGDLSICFASQSKAKASMTCVRNIADIAERARFLIIISTELNQIRMNDEAISMLLEAHHLANNINDEVLKMRLLSDISVEMSKNASYLKAEEIGLEMTEIKYRHACWEAIADFTAKTMNWRCALLKGSLFKNYEANRIYLSRLSKLSITSDCNEELILKVRGFYQDDIESMERLLLHYALHELFFNEATQDEVERLNRTLNIQWAIDIKNSLNVN